MARWRAAPAGSSARACRQLPLPAGTVLPAVAQGKGADLHGDQVRPQVVEEFPGPGLAPGVAVDRADEDEAKIGDIFPNGVSPQYLSGQTTRRHLHIWLEITRWESS